MMARLQLVLQLELPPEARLKHPQHRIGLGALRVVSIIVGIAIEHTSGRRRWWRRRTASGLGVLNNSDIIATELTERLNGMGNRRAMVGKRIQN